ncbi:MAG: F0F1 ATP synthase subunit delta [Hahellaceae bacterium]|nr:F0F1 ATP synthase subunit delta [Hahellaceae bacterium]
MTLDPTTFVLEIINFLVLVWLLQRFLYRPVRAAIVQRQQTLEQAKDAAVQREAAASAIQTQYEQQLAQWEIEQGKKREILQQQLMQERTAALNKINDAVQAEKTRQETLLAEEAATREQRLRDEAALSALNLAGRMLRRLASPALEATLIQVAAEDIAQMPDAERTMLQNALNHHPVNIQTAYDCSDKVLKPLVDMLTGLTEQTPDIRTRVDNSLICGLYASVGDYILHANLRDELVFFRSGLNHGRH